MVIEYLLVHNTMYWDFGTHRPLLICRQYEEVVRKQKLKSDSAVIVSLN